MLRTMDMWEMAFAVKTKPEDNVPAYRKQLPAVVRYPELVENNGAWLASKIRQRLAARPSGYPADAIVVCPDESGSRAFGRIPATCPSFFDRESSQACPRSLH